MGFILFGLSVASVLLFGVLLYEKRKKQVSIVCNVIFSILSIISVGVCIFHAFHDGTNISNAIILVSVIALFTFAFAMGGNSKFSLKTFVAVNILVTLVAAFSLGLGAGCGYEEQRSEKNTVSLIEVSVSNDENVSFYIFEDDKRYTYLTYNSDTNKYETETFFKGDVELVESDDCDNPRLVEYERKANKNFWTFGMKNKKEYAFYVPTGTVARDLF